jgi:hypothetical protein
VWKAAGRVTFSTGSRLTGEPLGELFVGLSVLVVLSVLVSRGFSGDGFAGDGKSIYGATGAGFSVLGILGFPRLYQQCFVFKELLDEVFRNHVCTIFQILGTVALKNNAKHLRCFSMLSRRSMKSLVNAMMVLCCRLFVCSRAGSVSIFQATANDP